MTGQNNVLRISTLHFDPSSVDDRNTAESEEVIALLETIDDDLDENGIVFVKISDDSSEKEWGIDETPAVVYFENGIPYLYDGNKEKIVRGARHLYKLFNSCTMYRTAGCPRTAVALFDRPSGR